MRDKKKVMIGVLSVLVCIMAVGYALLAQELTINGTASIDSTWKVEITNITSKDVVGGAVNKTDPTYTATTANFSVGLTQPGDSITYDITVTNKGTLDAVVESIDVDKGNNPAITYTTSGLKRGDKIAKNNGTNTLTIKVDYDSSITSQPASTTNDITVTINYQQDLGQIDVTHDFNGTGTIYRCYTGETSGHTQTLSLNQNIEDYLSNDQYKSEWSIDPSTFNSINYLKHEVSNNIITASYLCFIADNTEHCMQGGKDSNNQSYYQSNVGVLQGVQNWFTSNSGSCDIDASGNYSLCSGAGFGYVYAFSSDRVYAIASGVYCDVFNGGISDCGRL